jgi:hypothetical protein
MVGLCWFRSHDEEALSIVDIGSLAFILVAFRSSNGSQSGNS